MSTIEKKIKETKNEISSLELKLEEKKQFLKGLENWKRTEDNLIKSYEEGTMDSDTAELYKAIVVDDMAGWVIKQGTK